METRQLKLLGFAFTAFGAFLILMGVFAYFYEATHGGVFPWTEYPYRDYSFSLLILGAFIVTVSQIVAWWRKTEREP